MQMTKPLLSIIVPVHNTETYLPECVHSIADQSLFPRVELLLIDNDSTDNSANICKEFASKSENIHFFKQNQNGVSAARNLGLTKATGKYIMFIDSDDYIAPGMLEKLFRFAEIKCADMVCFTYCDRFSTGKTEVVRLDTKFTKKDELLSADLLYMSLFQQGGFRGYVWNKMYKRKAIQGIRFNEELIFLEDFIYNLDVIAQVTRVFCLPEPLYVYRQRAGSIVHSRSDAGSKSYFEALKLIEEKVPEDFELTAILMKKIFLIEQSSELILSNPVAANRCRRLFQTLPNTRTDDEELTISRLERLAINIAKRNYWAAVGVLIIRRIREMFRHPIR